MRGTVNTFFRGSIPLDTFIYKIIRIIYIYFYEHVEIGKQSPLKQEWS
jgi:hypothetical protein